MCSMLIDQCFRVRILLCIFSQVFVVFPSDVALGGLHDCRKQLPGTLLEVLHPKIHPKSATLQRAGHLVGSLVSALYDDFSGQCCQVCQLRRTLESRHISPQSLLCANPVSRHSLLVTVVGPIQLCACDPSFAPSSPCTSFLFCATYRGLAVWAVVHLGGKALLF